MNVLLVNKTYQEVLRKEKVWAPMTLVQSLASSRCHSTVSWERNLPPSTFWEGRFLPWPEGVWKIMLIDCCWDPDYIDILIVTEILIDGCNCSENDENNTGYFSGEWGWIGDLDFMAMTSPSHRCNTRTSHRCQSEDRKLFPFRNNYCHT